jgi:hypothetical protein
VELIKSIELFNIKIRVSSLVLIKKAESLVIDREVNEFLMMNINFKIVKLNLDLKFNNKGDKSQKKFLT